MRADVAPPAPAVREQVLLHLEALSAHEAAIRPLAPCPAATAFDYRQDQHSPIPLYGLMDFRAT